MTSETKFTPGPWKVTVEGRSVDLYAQYTDKHEQVIHHLIASVSNFQGTFLPPINHEANFRFMSATPDLYEALEEIMAGIDMRMMPMAPNRERAIKQAQSALAKARGEAS